MRSIVLLVATAAILTGCGSQLTPAELEASTPSPTVTADPHSRWESYRGVEVQVPARWTAYGVTGRQWCARPGPAAGEVGRPAMLPGFACLPKRVPLDKLRQHVWFEDAYPGGEAVDGERLGAGWVRDVVVSAGVRIEVQTREPALRQHILASVRTITVDANGCPVRHPIGKHPEYDAAGGLPFGTPVSGLTVCRYDLSGRAGAALLGSAAKPKAVAERVLAAIERLPSGPNPDLPVFRCLPEQARPDEAIVLRFATEAGVREIWVGYDGGGGSGFFNGSEHRGLYAGPLTLFATGPVRPAAGRYLAGLSGWAWR